MATSTPSPTFTPTTDNLAPTTTTTTTTTSPPSSPSAHDPSLYSALSAYPFSTDPDFQAGLSSILSSSQDPTTTTTTTLDSQAKNLDLILQAQVFYYTRKHSLPASTLSWKTYKDYLQTHNLLLPSIAASSPQQPPPPPDQPPDNSTPQYPLSFNHLLTLISENKPIPGIEQIPDTVLDVDLSSQQGRSADRGAPRRRKPWEKEEKEEKEEKKKEEEKEEKRQ
ncbi:MAG: hypothetical protein Q9227_004050 [Pyrenula ochraceoflavens]